MPHVLPDIHLNVKLHENFWLSGQYWAAAGPGQLTDTVLRQEVWGKYNLIVLDNAERLHPDTLGWICSHFRLIPPQTDQKPHL